MRPSDFTEAQLRYLKRVAMQMRAKSTGEIHIVLYEGGVREYHEGRKVRPQDLEESDDAFTSLLTG